MKRFFRIIWKVNAILICLVGLMLTAMLAFGLFGMAQSMTRTNESGAVAVHTEPPSAKETANLTIDKAEELDGTRIVRCSVQSGNPERGKIGSFSSGYTASATCNYVFYDLTTNQPTTLFPTNNNVVVESQDFYFPAEPCDKRVTKWTSYVVADKDTNHDSFISSDDLKSLAIAHADGKDYHVFLSDLDRVLKTELIGENDFYVFYEQDKSIFVTRIDLAAQKIIQTQKIF